MRHNLILSIMYLLLLFLTWITNAQDDCSITGFKIDYRTSPTGTYVSKNTRTICQLPEFYENSPAIATNIYGNRTDKQKCNWLFLFKND